MNARPFVILIGTLGAMNAAVQSLAAGLVILFLLWLVLGFFD